MARLTKTSEAQIAASVQLEVIRKNLQGLGYEIQ
jgi:hypothetical protein